MYFRNVTLASRRYEKAGRRPESRPPPHPAGEGPLAAQPPHAAPAHPAGLDSGQLACRLEDVVQVVARPRDVALAGHILPAGPERVVALRGVRDVSDKFSAGQGPELSLELPEPLLQLLCVCLLYTSDAAD